MGDMDSVQDQLRKQSKQLQDLQTDVLFLKRELQAEQAARVSQGKQIWRVIKGQSDF